MAPAVQWTVAQKRNGVQMRPYAYACYCTYCLLNLVKKWKIIQSKHKYVTDENEKRNKCILCATAKYLIICLLFSSLYISEAEVMITERKRY